MIVSRWGEASGKPFLPLETGLQRALRSREFTMRKNFSCFAFDDETAVAVQMVYAAPYQGMSWCNCSDRELRTECANKSYWGVMEKDKSHQFSLC